MSLLVWVQKLVRNTSSHSASTHSAYKWFLLFCTIALCFPPASYALELGASAPDFSLTSLKGEPVELQPPGRDSLLILFFFDSSPGSVEVLAKLDGAAQRSAGAFSVIGLSPENAKTLKKRINDDTLSRIVLIDDRGVTFNQYGFRGKLPAVVVVAPGGIVASISTSVSDVPALVRECADAFVSLQLYGAALNTIEAMPPDWISDGERNLINAYSRMLAGELDAAERILGSLAQRPNPPGELHAAVAFLLSLKGADADALAECAKAPKSGFANFVCGTARSRAGDCDAGYAAFRKAAKGDFMFGWQRGVALNMAARVSEESGGSQAAVGWYKKAFSVAPMNPAVNANLLTSHWENGNYPAGTVYAEILKATRVRDKLIRTLVHEFESAVEFSSDARAQKQLMERLETRESSGRRDSSDRIPRTILIYDLECAVCATEVRHLRVAAGGLLRESFEGISSLTAFKRVEILAAAEQLKIAKDSLDKPDMLAKLAKALGADMLVLGEIGNYKGQYVLNLRVADARSEEIIAVTSERIPSLDHVAPAIERSASSLMQKIAAHHSGG